MPKRKLFKQLSRSQQNRRLRKKLLDEDNRIYNEDDKIVNSNSLKECDESCFANDDNGFYNEDDKSDSSYPDEKCDGQYFDYDNSVVYIEDNNNAIYDSDEEYDKKATLLTLKEKLAWWMCSYNITHEAAKVLFRALKSADSNEIEEIPLDPRTLLGTPGLTVVRNVPPGKYFHYGLRNSLIDQFNCIDIIHLHDIIDININIDGLPLAKSSSSQLYPILGQIFPPIFEPFVIGCYHGYYKPTSCNLFLQEFIREYIDLNRTGFEYLNRTFKVKIRAVICDSPARSYVTYTKGHTGYFACGKCRVEGDWENHRMLFLDLNKELRTNENFLQRIDDDHHIGVSVFEEAQLGMVTQFPLDYMHLVCLGATKKILLTLLNGPHPYKFSTIMISEMASRLKNISQWVPSDFVRRCTEFHHVDRWKATQFRLFLLYIGPVTLEGYLPREYMIHFISFHTAIRILCHETDCIWNNEYANSLLIYFVETCVQLYGQDFLIYNIHCLIHLASEVSRMGPLDSFSAFPFESFLYAIKKRLKKAEKPLQQLHRRIVEKATCHLKKRKIPFMKPAVKDFNKQRTKEFNIVSYNTIYYEKFKLSSKSQRDKFCYLNNSTIIRIKNITINKAEQPTLIGESLINSQDFPDYPISSKEFNITVGNQWSETTTYDATKVDSKAVCIPYKDSFCFMPLIHSSIEDSVHGDEE